jgi:hypothetical protein
VEKRKKLLVLLAGLLILGTIAGFAAFPLPAVAAPSAPTPAATPLATDIPRTAPPLSLTLTLLFTCCALGAVVGVIVLGFVMGIQRRKDQPVPKKEP